MNKIRLGVNIDHVATLRNARGGSDPCPIRAAIAAAEGGADIITAHLREDRRHIRNNDIERLRNEINLPLNLEMAATEEMLEIALRLLPHAVCIVPEKRAELTTEGGLNVIEQEKNLADYIEKLQKAAIRVSLFVDPEAEQIKAAARLKTDAIELHTGKYAVTFPLNADKLSKAANYAANCGLEVHAGHGLNYDNVAAVAAIGEICELNIGHFIIGESLFGGMKETIKTMKNIINSARK